MLLFVCYSIALDSTDISASNKGKTSASTNGVEAYIKEQLAIKIQRFTIANVQLVTNKIKTKKIKVNLETDKAQLLKKKNSLVVKREELRVEIAAMNVIRSSNVLVCRQQNPLLKLIRDKFKVKRSFSFDSLKDNLQKFFTRIRYYQRFYQ